MKKISLSIILFCFSLCQIAQTGQLTLSLNEQLILAINTEKINELKILLAKGANANSVDSGGISALMLAVTRESQNTDEIAKILIQNGANVNLSNSFKETILMLAISNKKINYNLIELIVSKSSNLNAKDSEGNTALFYAIKKNDFNISRLLIEKGANINLQNIKGKTPLMISISNSINRNKFFNEISKFLILKNADVNIKDNARKTPLMYAAFLGNIELLRFIILKGADYNAKNKYNNSVLTYAVASGNEDIQKVLKRKGAILIRSSRFKDNGDGTLTDTTTGLMWEKKLSTECNRTWHDAIKFAKDSRLAGYKNWRLPTIDEFKILLKGHLYDDVQQGEEEPYIWLNCNGFIKLPPNWFWSSSGNNEDYRYVWTVSMVGREIVYSSKDDNSGSCVLCVRNMN